MATNGSIYFLNFEINRDPQITQGIARKNGNYSTDKNVVHLPYFPSNENA